MMDYVSLLRRRRQFTRALDVADTMLERSGYGPSAGNGYLSLVIERSRIHAAQGNWAEAEREMDTLFRVAGSQLNELRTGACLLRGFLRERRGDKDGALKAWNEGILEVDDADPASGYEFLHNFILLSLAGRLTVDDADRLVNKVIQSLGENSLFGAIPRAARVPPQVMQQMWRTPRGTKIARQIALGELSFADTLRFPVMLMASEWMRQGAISSPSADQEELIWELAATGYRAFREGKIPQSKILALGLAWKGTTGVFGWGGAASSLSPALRGPAAYVLGHRYLNLKRPSDALSFFQTARADAGADSRLARLADLELRRLKVK